MRSSSCYSASWAVRRKGRMTTAAAIQQHKGSSNALQQQDAHYRMLAAMRRLQTVVWLMVLRG
jgi:hypothetical protein